MIEKILKKQFRFFIINNYFNKNSIKKLHIGCGWNILQGWLNTDIDIIKADIYQDASKKFPFKDETFDYVFCENFIEHIPFDKGKFFLEECKRVLRERGVLRVSTPDLRLLIKMYEDKNPFVKRKEIIKRHEKITRKKNVSSCELFNDKMRRWGHVFVYDEELLISSLKKAGFKDIIKIKYGESKHKELQNVEHHADIDWMRFAEPMIFECKK